MKRKVSTAGVALAALIGLAAMAGPADAKLGPVDPGRVQALAAQIEAALTRLGPDATAQQDIAAIQQVISESGASPYEAEAALEVVQGSGLSQTASSAVASVNQTIEVALAGSGPQAGSGGGPGGGSPIGSPPAYSGGSGSNYQTR
jgi:hypothetical protein